VGDRRGPWPQGAKGLEAGQAAREAGQGLVADSFPKPTHTFTIERTVPVVSQNAGGFKLTGAGTKWVMYPSSSDAVPLSRDEYKRALDGWLSSLDESNEDAKAMAEANDKENVLQQLWAELEEDDDWKAYFVVLTSKSGMRFFEDKADAAPEADVKPVHVVGLEQIRGAGRAPGIDFYDGIIEVELVPGVSLSGGDHFVHHDDHHAGDTLRMRPQGSTALQNFLSAVNIYKNPPAIEEPPSPPTLASRSSSAQLLTARQSISRQSTTKGPALEKAKSGIFGGRKASVASPTKGVAATPRGGGGKTTKR